MSSVSLLKEKKAVGEVLSSVWSPCHLSYPWGTQMEAASNDSLTFCRRFRLDMFRGARLWEEHVAGEGWV